MTKASLLAIAIAATAIATATAQETFMSDTPEASVVRQYLDLINQNRVDDAFALLADDFVQHNPTMPSGKADNHAAFTQMLAGVDASYDVRRLIADGEYVAVHGHLNVGGADMAAADIYRVEGGRIVEHWDVLQPVPENPVNPNPMF